MKTGNESARIWREMPGLSGFAWTGIGLAVLAVSTWFGGLYAEAPVVWWLLAAVTVANVVWDQSLPDREPSRVDVLAGWVGAVGSVLALILAAAVSQAGFGLVGYAIACGLALFLSLPLTLDALGAVAGRLRAVR